MSSNSDLTSIVAELQFSNYISLAIAMAVVYDYVITFSREINYVWNRSWSFVSVMFIIIRYVGLFTAITGGLFGSIFIPGSMLVSTVLFIASDYAFTIFLAAADSVMILRVYAMYNKSKTVLSLLLILYITTIVLYCTSSAFIDNPNTVLSMTNPQILDMSICSPVFNSPPKLGHYKVVPRITLAALMLVLALAKFCADSYQAYKETRSWETNRYINLLVREGVLYFLAHLFNNMDFGQNTLGVIANAIVYTVMFVLSSRFVISVRALHTRNLIRAGGQCGGIDSGFGLSKDRSSRFSSVSSVGFVHAFVAREENVEMAERIATVEVDGELRDI